MRVGRKSRRSTAGIIGGGVTGKATRPTGVVDAARQKERASAFLPDLPSATRKKIEALRATKSLTAGDKHSAFASFLRQSVGCPVLPLWRTLVHSFPRYPGDTSRCGLRPPIKSARRAHNSCTVFVPTETRRSSARSRSLSHGLGSCVKTKPLRRRAFRSVLTHQRAMRGR
jgi:hypothetical protein